MSHTEGGYIFCPACGCQHPEDDPCDHYKKYGWKPGENEQFFIKLIQQGYVPGSSMGWKKNRKSIGTSCGNTRTKNSLCKWRGCNKDLNGMTYFKQQKHVQDHKDAEEESKKQSTLL